MMPLSRSLFIAACAGMLSLDAMCLTDGTQLRAQGKSAAAIAYPTLAVYAGTVAGSSVIAEVPFADSVLVLGSNGKAVRGVSARWSRVRWNGQEGWAVGAYLLPGAELSAKDVTAEELARCGRKCEKVFLKALATMVKLTPQNLRPSKIPFSVNALTLERSDGETNCWELAGAMENLSFRGSAVNYSNCLGGPVEGECGDGDTGCVNSAIQTGSYTVRGSTVVVNLRAGKRIELSCRDGRPIKEQSPVSAAGFRLHWISRINGFMTDDEIRSFDYANTWYSSSARGFVTYENGLNAFFCHADEDPSLDGKDGDCREVLRKLAPEKPYGFTGYFRKK